MPTKRLGYKGGFMTTKIEKPWGFETLIECNDKYAVKLLHVNKGCRLSLQYHNKKHETMYILRGYASIEINNSSEVFGPGEDVVILPKKTHRVTALKNTVIFEVSTPELDDIIRLEDDYGRVNK